VIITILWIIISGFTHRQVNYTCLPTGSQSLFSWAFFILVGRASIGTIYSFLGYYNVCHLGGEIRDPGKNIPRSIFISIVCIAVLYLAMNISIVGVIPWQQAMHSDFVVSLFMEKIYGIRMAQLVTVLILWIAFASLFAVVLGYSRVPYAAAADGHFFPFFAWLHPRKDFPYVSLLFIGGLGFLLSLTIRLEFAIKAILAMRILVQFVAQAVGVVLLRKSDKRPSQRGAYGPTGGTAGLPFKMWLYPIPVIVSIGIWLFVWYSTGVMAVMGLVLAAVGGVVFFATRGRWEKVK
jgi:amino acid transporter